MPGESSELGALWRRYDARPVRLVRTREGRELSFSRFERAHEFHEGMENIARRFDNSMSRFFYSAGIVAQLALSSHLLDVGFPDMWCAKYVGLHVDRSLAYANATGFGYEDAETKRLMEVLSPYWKWNTMSQMQGIEPGDGGFTQVSVAEIITALVEHVAEVTGHTLKPRRRAARSCS
ncbi:hypothetical protein BES08_21515 (plasmid) [Novosphingobium resinovorum]|uniref:HEPN domain-containing protein n=1 Tax=Novosphingobium resinovorum TaxID=158500 RepID=A0A1D8ADF1_9SPHN|nr:hypothetical protein BES08_21515 [Novosphingobium resinovorum]